MDDLYEDVELWYPRLRVGEADYGMRVAALEIKTARAKRLQSDRVLKGRKARFAASKMISNAGAIWVDEAAVRRQLDFQPHAA